MISKFFINHPVFASVISIIITLVGLVAMKALPIEQFPNMTPPLIQVTATFNGANADVMANDVAAPLEQQILGVDNMIYMYSQSSSTGSLTLQCYFEIGTDVNMNQVNVQNYVSQALAQLPESVQQQGVIVNQQSPNILMVVSLQSPDGRYDQDFLSNYTQINVVNELLLLPGISSISVIGQRNYSMRIWLRPDQMATLGISTNQVIKAVQEQNQDYGIGQFGQAPNAEPVVLTIPLASKGRLTTPEEFENIVIKADMSGNFVFLKDIAKIDLGAQNYMVDGGLDGKPAIQLAIYQDYGTNAIDLANSIDQSMKKLSQGFPEGISYMIPYDTTHFIHSSIEEVVKTIFIAALLVIFVVFCFLQNFRATLIPVTAMIVSIIGTFGGMYLLGFTINTLTLFGMVLAIGIVVDDAIVVVENVERNMQQHNLNAKDASIKAMEEVQGPVVAIVFVLCSVFIPVAFLGGIAGQLYKQFAITIAVSVVISGFVALSLSPTLTSLILKPRPKERKLAKLFNQGLSKLTDKYLTCAKWFIKHRIIGLIIFAGVLSSLVWFARTVPTSFVPNEDQGYVIAIANLPDGASLDRNVAVADQIQAIANAHEGVERVIALTGFSLLQSLNRTNIGTNFIMLKPWKERKAKNLHADAILKDLEMQFIAIQDAQVLVVNPPAIQGLGTVGGFEFWIENKGDGGKEALEKAVKDFIKEADSNIMLGKVHTTAEFNNLQYYVDLDRPKARALGVTVNDAYQTLQTLLGSVFINNFNKFGRVYQVIVQALPEYREQVSDLGNMYVTSSNGKMVPLKSIMSITPTKGQNLVSRFNDFSAAQIIAGPAPGYSSGQGVKAMIEVAKKTLGPDMGYGWSGIVYQQIASGGTSSLVLLAGLVMIFLVLAALYEKWTLPLSILMAVPFGAFGAFLTIYIRKMPNDVYFQIGLVALIALAAKNAILIIEFAKIKYEEGMGVIESAIEAAHLRFRAILMTSLTFILGVLPLVISQGAGAASRHSVGTGVLGGMISATFLALLFVPLFFTFFYKERK